MVWFTMFGWLVPEIPRFENQEKLLTQQRTIGKYRTIEIIYMYSTFFNNFISLIDKYYQNTSLVQISAKVRQKYGYYKQNNREQ